MTGLLHNTKLRFQKIYKGSKIWDIYLICFFTGLIAGTVMAHLWHSFLLEEAGYYLELLSQNINLEKAERIQLFGHILSQRLTEVSTAWLVVMTSYALPFFCVFMSMAGFGMGLLLSVITVQKGLMGLPVFFMTVMPQSLCYLPVCVVFLFLGIQKERHFRIPAFILIFVLTAAGSTIEAWINPFFLKLVL